jgi:hypothetical protein
VARIVVQGPDALLEREQALVDFSTLQACLAVVVERVSTPLTASQINEADLANLSGRQNGHRMMGQS